MAGIPGTSETSGLCSNYRVYYMYIYMFTSIYYM